MCARPKTDVVIMANGDRLTCEIKKMDHGVLYAGFDYVDGTVSIDWSKVARVESNQLFYVQTQDGTVYRGTLQTVKSPGEEPVRIEVLDEPGPPEVVPHREVVEVAQTSGSLWRRVSGNFDTGLIYTRGNETTQYNLGSSIRLRRELWSAEADLASALSKSAGVTGSTRNQLTAKGLRLVGSNKWFVSSFNEFLQSSQQGISLQTSIGGGIGKHLKDTNSVRLSLTGGLAWQDTQYDTAQPVDGTQNVLAGMVVAEAHLLRFKKTAFDATAVVLPALTQPGRLRFNTNAAYSIQIISNLWWKLSFYGNWDNRPPLNLSGADYGSSMSISYSFN